MFKNLMNVKNISLALGSGSAKGMAHIGVIESLEKAGCNITAISGTSMGGIVAAYYALGKLDQLKEWFLGFGKRSTFMTIDFSFTGGFISGNKLVSNFEQHLGQAKFEDTRIPLFIPATNLDTGEETIFSSGHIVPAIRSSISVPGVFKPYYFNGAHYVDGAVLNPVPVNILKEKGYKNIIAVHLSQFIERRDSKDTPGMVETMGRSMGIVSKALANAQMTGAKVVVAPNLSCYGMFEMYKAQEIMDMGKEEMDKMIDEGCLRNSFSNIVSNIIR